MKKLIFILFIILVSCKKRKQEIILIVDKSCIHESFDPEKRTLHLDTGWYVLHDDFIARGDKLPDTLIYHMGSTPCSVPHNDSIYFKIKQ